MHCSRMEDGVEAFVQLGCLIVEGRVVAEGTARGYREGPHCPRPAASLNAHRCLPADFLCVRAERLRKHMSLLCSNAVPMCIEVLLCPVCQCGTERAQNPEVANIPSSSDLLLEQWTVSVIHVSGEPCSMSVRGLFQAVRSQLHFSQLSAWWSNSRGVRPSNVRYRVTLPEQAFASHFSRPPQLHSFPPAAVGPNTQLKVSVRTLPRCESVPVVKCAACTPETSTRKRSVTLEQPLLGESLLDPPGPGPSTRAHAGLCKWHTSSPPSPPRRRASRQPPARRCDKPPAPTRSLHIMPLPGPVDDRMQTTCKQSGKHDCRCEEEVEELSTNLHHSPHNPINEASTNRINLDLSKKEMEEVLTVLRVRTEEPVNTRATTERGPGKAEMLLSAILRTSNAPPPLKRKLLPDPSPSTNTPPDINKENKNNSSSHLSLTELQIANKNQENRSDSLCLCKVVDCHATSVISDNPFPTEDRRLSPSTVDSSNSLLRSFVDHYRTKQCLIKDDTNKCQELDEFFVENFSQLDLNKRVEGGGSVGRGVPTALDKAKFRRSLDSAASMVFHWRTGLPLTSSPAPLRRTHASHRFDFDSTINSVSAIRSALFDSESGEDTESEGSSKSPCSPQMDFPAAGVPWPLHYQSPCSALLGSFEESVLNGRLEPVSTVHGFSADLGASGSFCPAHLTLPVTVFFYTLGDNDKVSTPYLAHINLGKKGYVVPRCGTIQVTLLNPLGTVVKMFVVMYNLTDMPSNSHTFLRHRTLYMPTAMSEPPENSQKYLRYLIHLRFASSKSGRVSLHTDIRMIIFRKSDLDTATGHGADLAYELRSFTHGPTNPKFSPRK